jgi:5-methylthioadenosine/S-adenosylhomocysteine deaminase
MGTPATGRIRDAGMRPAVGVDSVIASSGDMFEELRLGLLCERLRRAQMVFGQGRDVKSVGELAFTTREALESGTIGSAHAMWLGDRVGSLTPGKKADIILLRATDLNLAPLSDIVAAIVCGANSGNVDTVMVGGKIVKRDGKLVGIDVERIHALFIEARDRMFAYDNYQGMRPPALAASAR